mgnify:CR=1 FL=1
MGDARRRRRGFVARVWSGQRTTAGSLVADVAAALLCLRASTRGNVRLLLAAANGPNGMIHNGMNMIDEHPCTLPADGIAI